MEYHKTNNNIQNSWAQDIEKFNQICFRIDQLISKPTIKVKVYKTCKDYYCDPEWKKQHLLKMSKKEECDICHRIVSHVNLVRHKRSKLCFKYAILEIKAD